MPNSVLSSAPPRPVAQRGYATLVVALAAFLVAMAVLRIPFRGYLVESRVAGRLGDEFAPADARQWLTEAACDMQVRLDTYPGGRCEILIQQLAPRAAEAQLAIDRVAQRFVDQFVVERREGARQARLARLQAELQTARDAEDALRSRVEQLRQKQLAAIPRGMPPAQSPAAVPAFQPPQPIVETEQHVEQRVERLESLRIELSRLLASFTDQHPQVITLRAQIVQIQSDDLPASQPSVRETHIQHYEPVSTL
ncbi:MAG: hypothetical protein WD872_15720, partial [Pirellulaceae bacterium]